jgi:hypothetical protein
VQTERRALDVRAASIASQLAKLGKQHDHVASNRDNEVPIVSLIGYDYISMPQNIISDLIVRDCLDQFYRIVIPMQVRHNYTQSYHVVIPNV